MGVQLRHQAGIGTNLGFIKVKKLDRTYKFFSVLGKMSAITKYILEIHPLL